LTGLKKSEHIDAALQFHQDSRIWQNGQVNSTLHIVTELNPDALRIARTLDAERANGTIYGPLHGIPILIKNNIATMDKMSNTAGSYALLGAKVPCGGGMAAKLRKAGAIILGKTNLSQWANFRSYNTSNGWIAYGIPPFWSSENPRSDRLAFQADRHTEHIILSRTPQALPLAVALPARSALPSHVSGLKQMAQSPPHLTLTTSSASSPQSA
jgi:Asp-tRNA(Asn)/Glu-tRNA(Gln) amidotransferase A subunit family amidase